MSHNPTNRVSYPHRLFGFLSLVAAFLWLFLGNSPIQAAPQGQSNEPTANGYTYVVQAGDAWRTVADRTGVPVESLQTANPNSVRGSGWLVVGERLTIPVNLGDTIQTHVVAARESWNSIADQYNISARLLLAVNASYINRSLTLYQGIELFIPPSPDQAQVVASTASPTVTPPATATATVQATATPPATATATVQATSTRLPATATATTQATATPLPATATATATIPPSEPTATVKPTEDAKLASVEPVGSPTTAPIPESAMPPCPERFLGFPTFIQTVLAQSGDDIDRLAEELTACNALTDSDALLMQDITGDGAQDLLVTFVEPNPVTAFARTDLMVFVDVDGVLQSSFRARAAGVVQVLATADINQDQQPDLVWSDTTCGANTCFDTLYIRSWNGASWQNWSDDLITMASATIRLEAIADLGQGQSLVLEGGQYGSAGAGPQRDRAEIWSSVDGMPYSLLQVEYAPAEYLFHLVLDANQAMAQGTAEGYAKATQLYTQALTDDDLKIWKDEGERSYLRDFSRFRLAVLAAYQADPDGAQTAIGDLLAETEDDTFTELGQSWLAAYQSTGNPLQACAEANTLAADRIGLWEPMDQFGYANPDFKVKDFCPILDVELDGVVVEPVVALVKDAGETAAEPAVAEPAAAEPTTNSPTPASEGGEASATPSDPAVAEETPADEGPVVDPDMPTCPTNRADYGDVLKGVLTTAAGDPLSVEIWLRLCEAVTEERGAMLHFDLNNDDIDDFIIFPTLISDTGYGPGGADGAVLIYYGAADSHYTLAVAPDIFGLPTPLTLKDSNLDGRPDLIWKVESCGSACRTSIEILSWDGEAYTAGILPGANLAAGTVTLQPVPAGSPGVGEEIVLQGGVSGLPNGGLAVPRTEIWQSVDGAPYARISLLYDREFAESQCLGLRLIEADTALQAMPALGYEPAIQQYQQLLADQGLTACSIVDTEPEEEIQLLRGLANFRLIQALALNGEIQSATAIYNDFLREQPDSDYADAAGQWLDLFTDTENGEEACDAIFSIIEDNPSMWRITDNFGIDHPTLAPEQICYVP